MCYIAAKDNEALAKRLDDAERKLAAEQSRVERELEEARNSAATCEEERAKRLLGLMRVIGGW